MSARRKEEDGGAHRCTAQSTTRCAETRMLIEFMEVGDEEGAEDTEDEKSAIYWKAEAEAERGRLKVMTQAKKKAEREAEGLRKEVSDLGAELRKVKSLQVEKREHTQTSAAVRPNRSVQRPYKISNVVFVKSR